LDFWLRDLKSFCDRFDQRENISKRCTDPVRIKSRPGHTACFECKNIVHSAAYK
jgi:hypothetical protein